jgi:DNA-binding response OmpR family regulator
MVERVTEVRTFRRHTMTKPKRPIAARTSRKRKAERPFHRLLLVEDDDLVAAGLTTLLELEGFEMLTIGRGLAVVEAVKTFEPDAVILDLTLPDLDGVRVFRRLRRRWPDLPVVFSTGHGGGADPTTELKGKRVELLRKPYEIGELLAALERIAV